MTPITCPYCRRRAELAPMSTVGLEHEGNVWVCTGYPECDSYVVASPDGTPLGTLADRDLRWWRRMAKQLFNRLWNEGHIRLVMKNDRDPMRTRAYNWLAGMLGITAEECHFGRFNTIMCQRAYGVIHAKFKHVLYPNSGH